VILGFAYRSPDVIRLTLDRAKYACVVIPRCSESGDHVKAYSAAKKQTFGNRRLVFLYSECKALASLTRNKVFDSNSDVHIVFDGASVLTAKSCVEIVDAQMAASNQAVWQYQKTLPSMLAKMFDKQHPGVSKDDIDCLNAVAENPEDRIKSDVPKRVKQKHVKTFRSRLMRMHERSNNSQEFRCALTLMLLGVYASKQDVTAKKRNLRGIGIQQIGTYKSGSFGSQYTRFKKHLRLMEVSYVPSEKALRKLYEHTEYRQLMLGMYLLHKGVSVDKAASDTGCDPNVLTWLKLGYEHCRSNIKLSEGLDLTLTAFPLRIVKRQLAVTHSVEAKAAYRSHATIFVPKGSYNQELLLRAAKILKPGENLTMIKASKSGASFTTNIPKYKNSSETTFLVEKDERYFIKFKSSRTKVKGV
jgi:hypothetical protein